MDTKEALELFEVFIVQVKNEEDIDEITAVMLRLAWQAFIGMIYKSGYEIVDRTVDEEYVRKGEKDELQ